MVAPRPVPVLRGRGGVLGVGRDRPAAAGYRRGRPGRGRRREAGRRAGPVRDRPSRAGLYRTATGPTAGNPLCRRRLGADGPPGTICRMAAVLRAAGGGAAGGPAGRGRPVRRRGTAGLPGLSHRLGPGPADLRAGVRPARTRPGPARVRRRPEPEHADPGPAGSGVYGGAGRGAGARDAAGGAGQDHRPGPGHPAVRRGDRAVADRPRTSPSPSRASTAWSATSASWPSRTACTRCWPPGSTHWTRMCGGWSPTPRYWAPPSRPRP
jgi:hypothetical protein